MTAFDSNETDGHAKSAGFRQVISKPVDFPKLMPYHNASFDLCVELADDLKVSFRVSQRVAARH